MLSRPCNFARRSNSRRKLRKRIWRMPVCVSAIDKLSVTFELVVVAAPPSMDMDPLGIVAVEVKPELGGAWGCGFIGDNQTHHVSLRRGIRHAFASAAPAASADTTAELLPEYSVLEMLEFELCNCSAKSGLPSVTTELM